MGRGGEASDVMVHGGADVLSKISTAAKTGITKTDVRLKDRTTTCINCHAELDVPHDMVFDLLADPNNHEQIFDAIESAKVSLVDDAGPRRTWHLDYQTRWKFWKIGGVCENKVVMHTDRNAGTVSFKLREPGFLKTYEGEWSVRPLGTVLPIPPAASLSNSGQLSQHLTSSTTPPATSLTIQKMMCPKYQPPYPLNLSLKSQAAAQVVEMVNGLISACKLKAESCTTGDSS